MVPANFVGLDRPRGATRSEDVGGHPASAPTTPGRPSSSASAAPVEKFIGDAVVAVFGAPVAHEDDAERAVRAALAVREAIVELNADDPDLELSVRVGAATGEALVNLNARPEQGEELAAGDAQHRLAPAEARLRRTGSSSTSRLRRLTENTIEYREAEASRREGQVGAPSRVGSRSAQGSARRGHRHSEEAAPLVGRSTRLKRAARRGLPLAARSRTTARHAGRRPRHR